MVKQLISRIKNVWTGVAVRNFLINRNPTRCPRLWSTALINQDGNVYTCCHVKPGVLGNIYKSNLGKIWTKSLELKMYRWMSLNKCFYCALECNLLSNKEKKMGKSGYSQLQYPKKIWIMFGEFCNLRCVMCRQNHQSSIILDDVGLKKNVDWTRVEDIMFFGGEILAMKKAREMFIWLTQKANKKVDLVTNGVLINDEWIEYLVRGSNCVVISVNAATKETHEFVNKNSNFVKVIDNMRKLIEFKHRYDYSTTIAYRFTIVPENIHELAAAIKFADSLSCDAFFIGYDVAVPNYLRKNNVLREQIKREVFQLLQSNLKISIPREKFVQLGLLERKQTEYT